MCRQFRVGLNLCPTVELSQKFHLTLACPSNAPCSAARPQTSLQYWRWFTLTNPPCAKDTYMHTALYNQSHCQVQEAWFDVSACLESRQQTCNWPCQGGFWAPCQGYHWKLMSRLDSNKLLLPQSANSTYKREVQRSVKILHFKTRLVFWVEGCQYIKPSQKLEFVLVTFAQGCFEKTGVINQICLFSCTKHTTGSISWFLGYFGRFWQRHVKVSRSAWLQQAAWQLDLTWEIWPRNFDQAQPCPRTSLSRSAAIATTCPCTSGHCGLFWSSIPTVAASW